MQTPNHEEFDRFAAICAKLLTKTLPRGTDRAAVLATACLVYNRGASNVVTHWEIDPESFVREAIRSLQRFVEIKRWAARQHRKAETSIPIIVFREAVRAIDN